MQKIIWISRGAFHMCKLMGRFWPSDIAYAWSTASTIYCEYEYSGILAEIGDPVEEIEEELSRWGD